MSKREKKILEINKLCHNDCNKSDELCPRLKDSRDISTSFANLGWRAIFTLISWVLLLASSDGSGFFVALAVMCMVLLKDYSSFLPKQWWRRNIRHCMFIFVFLVAILTGLTIIGVLEVTIKHESAYLVIIDSMLLNNIDLRVSLLTVWLTAGLFPFFTIFDWLTNITPLEEAINM